MVASARRPARSSLVTAPRLALAALVGALVLTGCGSDDEEAANAGASDAGGAGGGAAEGGTEAGAGGADAADHRPFGFTGELTTLAAIPARHKCLKSLGGTGTGDNLSPPLEWGGVPGEARSLALLLVDVRFDFLHWALFDIPAATRALPEGIPAGYEVQDPAGAHQSGGYFGPCSDGPTGSTYAYRLHALSIESLGVAEGTPAPEIRAAIEAASLGMIVWEAKPE
ncbi:MAG: YbhB/YbcL family Raf kinase inhibitor-like protein [Deltaproteobacteria bacterium]|nr:YbhB/YbcL family Raf kinase inhibitor-like protein [Deltaproteobacteria bacterium]